MEPTYYIVRTGPNRFDMRQTRYKAQRAAGKEHPHDLMATQFTRDGMIEILDKHFADSTIDRTELDKPGDLI